MELKNLSKYRQVIFGIAIILVMTFHYCEDALQVIEPADFWYPFLRHYWDIFCGDGVDMFAFLSGMGLYFSFSAKPDLKAYYTRRLKKVVIPYMIIASVFWFIRDILIKHKTWKKFFKDLFFVTFFTKDTVTFWYILFSVVMYLVFPLLYYLFTRKGSWRWIHFIWVMILALGICVFLNHRYSDFFGHVYLALTRGYVFVLGCFMGKHVKEEKKIPLLIIPVIFVLTLLFRIYVVHHSTTLCWWMFSLSWFGLSLMFLLAWILGHIPECALLRFLKKTGTYSMELYMIHVAVRNILRNLGYPTHALWPWKFLLSLLFVAMLSVASHHGIQKLMDLTFFHQDMAMGQKS